MAAYRAFCSKADLKSCEASAVWIDIKARGEGLCERTERMVSAMQLNTSSKNLVVADTNVKLHYFD